MSVIPLLILEKPGFCLLISWLVITLPSISAKAITLADVFLVFVGLPSITSTSSNNSESFMLFLLTWNFNPALVLALVSLWLYIAAKTVLGTPVAWPSVSNPSGIASITNLAFFKKNCWADLTSVEVKFALLFILVGDIPKRAPTVFVAALGTCLKLSTLDMSMLAAVTSASISLSTPSFSATTISFVLRVSLCSTASSATTPLASVTSSSNSVFSILLAASIDRAGRNLFM